MTTAQKKPDSKRKMTQAILEEQQKEKEVYEFLEDDDDFEEFEIRGEDADFDMEMAGGADKMLWQQNWDDEAQEGDFQQ